MKKNMALLMTVAMVFSAISTFSVTASAKQKYKFTEMNTFKDVSASHPAKYDIEYMENEGYVTGISKKAFEPETPVTVTDFAEWLCAVLGWNGLSYEIYGGIPVGSEETLTKEEAAQMLHNAAVYRGNDISWIHILTADYTSLTDADNVSEWAENAVSAMYRCHVIASATETELKPQQILTRAEAVMILKEFAQQFVWAGPTVDDGGEWVMTFNDEFETDGLDTNVWTAMDEAPTHILSSRHPENVEVHDGNMYLIIKNESRVEGFNWTAGNSLANKGFTQAYGYWEARYKIAPATGINNSFWMMINGNREDARWYEIDVNEGKYPYHVDTNLHSSIDGVWTQNVEKYQSGYNLSEDYHTYAVEWTPEYLKYYFDGALIATKENTVKGSWQAFPRLSSAVYAGAGTVGPEADGTAQIIDYVRIWQRAEDIEAHTTATQYSLDGDMSCKSEHIEANGNSCEHYRCKLCGKRFADSDGKAELNAADVTKPVPDTIEDAKLNVAEVKENVKYRSNVKITATAENIPDGYKLVMFVNGIKVQEGTNTEISYTVGRATDDINYNVRIVDADGNITKDSSGNYLYKESKVTVNTKFFARLIAFFRSIFNIFPMVEVKP